MEKEIKFKKRVWNIFWDCVAPEKDAYQYTGYILGEARYNDFVYKPDKLKEHTVEITLLVYSLRLQKKKDLRFEDLKCNDNGETWTELNFYADLLLSMANALHILDFKNDRIDWTEKEKKNPELIFVKGLKK